MEQPTAEEIKKFEIAHKDQFYNLAIANKLWIEAAKKVAGKPNSDPARMAVIDYGKTIVNLGARWQLRQNQLVQAGVKQTIVKFPDDFMWQDKLPKIEMQLKEYFPNGKLAGMGWIPLLIWGGIAIAAFFSASYITDELNETAQEKAVLMNATGKLCAEQNLTPAQCQQLVSQTQAEASQEGGLTSTLKWGAIAALAFMAFQSMNRTRSN